MLQKSQSMLQDPQVLKELGRSGIVISDRSGVAQYRHTDLGVKNSCSAGGRGSGITCIGVASAELPNLHMMESSRVESIESPDLSLDIPSSLHDSSLSFIPADPPPPPDIRYQFVMIALSNF